MTHRSNDVLLRFGKSLALGLRALCALAGGITLLLIPIVILASQDMLPRSLGLNDLPIIELSALAVVSILLMLTAIVAALFAFFGKMGDLIKSVGEGDPFIPENARRLNGMAWLLLATQVLAIPIAALRFYLANNIDGAPPEGNNFHVSLYDLEGVLLAIVLFILARVFRHGAAMRADLAGTV